MRCGTRSGGRADCGDLSRFRHGEDRRNNRPRASAVVPSAGELRHDLLDEQRERRHPPVAQPANRAIDLPQAVRVSTCWRGVASALLQNLDHDLFFEQWRPPPTLFARPEPARPAPAWDRPLMQGRQGADRGPCSSRSGSSSGRTSGAQPTMPRTPEGPGGASRARNRTRGTHRGKRERGRAPSRARSRFPPAWTLRLRSRHRAPGRLARGSRRSSFVDDGKGGIEGALPERRAMRPSSRDG